MNAAVDTTKETLALVLAAQQKSSADIIAKNFTQPSTAVTGLQAYDLEAPSKKLFPLLTPLRNRLPRVGGGFAIQANWKAITGINNIANLRAGVSEGKRGPSIAHVLAERLAAYRGIGVEKSTTFEADYAAKGFEDVKAQSALQALQALMVAEELIILGGNTGLALGTTPTPTVTANNGAGTLAAQTWSIIVVALGLQAYWDVAGANNGNSGQALDLTVAVVPGVIARTNADGSTDNVNGGTARQSAAASQATSGGASTLNCSVTSVKGAYAYAWFIGTAGSERLAAVSTINSVLIATAPGGGNQLATTLAASDNSQNALEFDGLLTLASTTSLGSYYNALATGTVGVGTTLTGAGGRIAEIDAALGVFFAKYRLQPTDIYVSYVQFQKITNVILGQTNPSVYFTVDINAPASVLAGRNVGQYLSPITGSIINIVVHPNMVPGTMLFYTAQAPGYVDGITDICRIRTRQEYYQIEWPLRTRKYEYGVYADEVLQHFFPPSMGILTNIA